MKTMKFCQLKTFIEYKMQQTKVWGFCADEELLSSQFTNMVCASKKPLMRKELKIIYLM